MKDAEGRRRAIDFLNFSFPMFRIFGIAVRIHWAMLLMYAIYFSQAATSDGWRGVGMMAVTQVILLVSILFHEFGHCWMAVRHRGHAEKILIWPLGGYSIVEYDRGPRQQLQVAGIGPVSSLLLSGICFGALAATGVALRWDHALPFEHWYPIGFSLTQTFLLHAARLNLLLAIFNLVVPAYPLDGGQVLFALLSLKFGRLRAAQTMAAISIPVGAAIAFAGLATVAPFLILIGIQVIYEGNQLRYFIRIGELDAHPGMGAASGPEFEYMPDRPKKKGFFARWKDKRARAALDRDRDRDLADRARVDAVLEKVSREGIGSLTADERRILDEASRRSRGGD
jgi:Zn-dependent protease